VRPTSDPAKVGELERLGVATFRGDVAERASMREGMSGADWVVHAAADLDIAGPLERMRRANVDGSESVASLAYKLGVGRLLSVSSMAAFGGSPADGSRADEDSPAIEPFPTSYSATKHAGQRAIEAWAARGLALTTVYPSLIYGPPGKRQGANAVLRQLVRGRLPALVGGDRLASWVHIDDLIEAMMRIVDGDPPPPAGRGFLLAGDVIRLRDLVDRVCALAGVAPPRLTVALPLARAGVSLLAPLYRLLGRRPPFVPAQLRSLTRNWAFDDSRARRELGWQPRSLDEGLPATVEYLRG
jgi:nucleoside-diphosphate-sugar epimerase